MEQVHEMTSIDPWFLRAVREMVDFEAHRGQAARWKPPAREHAPTRQARRHLRHAARHDLEVPTELAVRARRKELGVHAVFNRVDTCAAEFESFTPYLYSSYESECEAAPVCRARRS